MERWNAQSLFLGKYVNGKERIGIYVWSDKSVYEGEWKNNFIHGFGIYKFRVVEYIEDNGKIIK